MRFLSLRTIFQLFDSMVGWKRILISKKMKHYLKSQIILLFICMLWGSISPGLAASAPDDPFPLLPKKKMTAIEYKNDPLAVKRERENPPFEFRGGAGTGRVIDRQGRVLLESSDERGIFGASVSPDKKKVLVDAANSAGGSCVVLEPEADRMVKLPARPPGANMFSLSWHWIGPNLLFGISGVEKVFHEGPHENCCNENNVAQTKFYTFDLLTEQLSEVSMPSAVTQPVVKVLGVMSDGQIHLQHEAPQEGVEPDLGWFKIDAEK